MHLTCSLLPSRKSCIGKLLLTACMQFVHLLSTMFCFWGAALTPVLRLQVLRLKYQRHLGPFSL